MSTATVVCTAVASDFAADSCLEADEAGAALHVAVCGPSSAAAVVLIVDSCCGAHSDVLPLVLGGLPSSALVSVHVAPPAGLVGSLRRTLPSHSLFTVRSL